MEKHKHPFVAGVLTGCLEATINYPLVSPAQPTPPSSCPGPWRGPPLTRSAPQEYTKSQIQLTKGVYSSPFDVVRQTVARAGPLGEAGHILRSALHPHSLSSRSLSAYLPGMYRGLSTFITFAPACVAVRFWAFDTSQRAIETAYPGIEERYLHFAAGLCSGAVEAALVLVPMETIAITLMHDQMSAERKYRGLVGPMVTMVREQGPRGVYRGLLPQVGALVPLRPRKRPASLSLQPPLLSEPTVPQLAKNSLNMCIRFGMYGVLKRKVQGPPEENRPFTELQALGTRAPQGLC